MKDIKTRLMVVCIGLTVISLMLTGQSSAKIDPKTAVGMWLFDEGEGDVAKDSSGNGNDGTLMNSPKWVDGKFGKALEFNGVDNYVDCGNDKSLSPSTQLTMVAWIMPTGSIPSYPTIISKTNGEYTLQTCAPGLADGTCVSFWINNQGDANTCRQEAAIHYKTWYHVAVTYDGSKAIQYHNGKAVYQPSFSTTIAPTANACAIGSYPGQGNRWNGIIDEVTLFNVALTVDDIKNLMENGVGRALGLTPVFPKGKLTTVWGEIKACL